MVPTRLEGGLGGDTGEAAGAPKRERPTRIRQVTTKSKTSDSEPSGSAL
jgi:hypothetical protein